MAVIKIGRAAEEDNDLVATEVRSLLSEHRIVSLNIMGASGAGKTSLIEATLAAMSHEWRFAAITADQYTSMDAERLGRRGITAVEINVEGHSYLSAQSVKDALGALELDLLDCIFIENVDCPICPSNFDIGHDYGISILSATEGTDKADKYPKVFRQAAACVITKIDLLPHVDFDIGEAAAKLRLLNPEAPVFSLSSRMGQGMGDWCNWIRDILFETAKSMV